jgi:hypothetical protein
MNDGEQSHGRAGAKHDSKLLGRQTARAEKSRQERRSDSERRIHRGIKEDKSGQGGVEGTEHGFPAKL